MPVPNLPTKAELINLITTNLGGSPNTIDAVEHRDVETALLNAIYGGQIGDIKEIACDNSYIAENFIVGTSDINEGRALLTSERYGWAICNGKNGTINKKGRVSIGYDPINYPITSAGTNIGGEKDVTLIESQMPIHNHGWTGQNGTGWPRDSTDSIVAGEDRSYARKTQLLNKGGGLPHNNMQPYIVTLFIQRIDPY